MAYEDPNAPSQAAATTASKKTSGSWDWLWPFIVISIIIRLFGLVAGLVGLGCYYGLQPKLGTWGAVAISGVVGAVVGLGLMTMIQG